MKWCFIKNLNHKISPNLELLDKERHEKTPKMASMENINKNLNLI
jgi:hypothetical protein